MESKVIEFAPIIIVVLFVFINWHLAVTPSELEKKHREILSEVEKKFVTWSVFNTLKEKVDSLDKKVDRVECKIDSYPKCRNKATRRSRNKSLIHKDNPSKKAIVHS